MIFLIGYLSEHKFIVIMGFLFDKRTKTLCVCGPPILLTQHILGFLIGEQRKYYNPIQYNETSTVGLQKTQQFKDPLLRGREILWLLLG